MNRKYAKLILITLSFFILAAFTGTQYLSACDSECKCINKCPLCKILNDDKIVENSKEKLLATKKKIEEAISNIDITKIGQQAVDSLQECLVDINKKLNSLGDESS